MAFAVYRYERYAENDMSSYGRQGPDPYKDLFPDFN